MTTPTKQREYLPCETKVLSTNDGEPGEILNAFSHDETGWYEYEVATQYGIERWHRDEFILMSELPDECK